LIRSKASWGTSVSAKSPTVRPSTKRLGKRLKKEIEEYSEAWPAERITISDGSQVKVYSLGAGSWIWEEASSEATL